MRLAAAAGECVKSWFLIFTLGSQCWGVEGVGGSGVPIPVRPEPVQLVSLAFHIRLFKLDFFTFFSFLNHLICLPAECEISEARAFVTRSESIV